MDYDEEEEVLTTKVTSGTSDELLQVKSEEDEKMWSQIRRVRLVKNNTWQF